MIKISLTSSAELPNEQTSNLPEEWLSMAAVQDLTVSDPGVRSMPQPVHGLSCQPWAVSYFLVVFLQL